MGLVSPLARYLSQSALIATCSGTVWKATTGRRWTDTGRKLPGRKVARTAVTSLAAADEHEQKLKDAHRVHQVLFDESAKQLMVALVHWDTDLDSPEITSAGVQRLRKQDAHTVRFHVMDRVKHVRQVCNGLSDNCLGMAAVYNGAMLAVFRDLKSVDKTPWFSVEEVDPEMPPLSHDDGGKAALPEEQQMRREALEGAFEERLAQPGGIGPIFMDSRLTRTPCMTRLVSTLHDWALVKALGKAPLYKQGRPKINRMLTFLLQQYHIFSTEHWDDIQELLDIYLGANFDTIFTEPDLNRWCFTWCFTGDAVNEATNFGEGLSCHRPIQFLSVFYYLLSSTRLNCDCGVVRGHYYNNVYTNTKSLNKDLIILHINNVCTNLHIYLQSISTFNLA